MSLTLGQVKQYARKFIGDRLTSNQVFTQDEYLTSVINDMVIPDLVGRHPWSWKYVMETGVINTGKWKFQLPPEYQDVALLIFHSGELANTFKLTYLNPQQFFFDFPDPSLETSGKPAIFTKLNKEIWFNRPLDNSYNLRVLAYKRFPRVELDNELFEFIDPDRHMVLAYGAAGMCFLTIEDEAHAKPWLTIYEATLNQMFSLDNTQEAETFQAGKFLPGEQAEAYVTKYWENPFIMSQPR